MGLDGIIHPVAYFSDTVKPSQKGWAPTTKEAFALLLTVQLRIENNVLTKSDRPVIPPSMRKFVTCKIHGTGHLGTDKTYLLLKQRFYWPNMFEYVKQYVASCIICQQVKCDTRPPEAPIFSMVIPDAQMQFISIDMPTDAEGYLYILLTGDTFSKFIQAVPLRDQTAPSIGQAFATNWLYIHGNPQFLLSDQGSNVDWEMVQTFSSNFGIEKRRSSPYHCAGFAERNIRNIRELLRAALLDQNRSQAN